MPLPDPLSQVLLALGAVLLTGAFLARLLRPLGQPPVIAEILAGIALGPSLLGERISGLLLPASAAPLLGILAQSGVILYLFALGQELRFETLERQKKALVSITLASLLAPFALGMALAMPLLRIEGLAGGQATPLNLALFLGIALAITAFPVLARILSERQMLKSELGTLALASAAIGDVLAWVVLAFVVGSLTAQASAGLRVALGTLLYLATMLLIVRPLVRRALPPGELAPASAALLLAGLLLSTLATEQIGIHALSGAFLFGAILPTNHPGIEKLLGSLKAAATLLLLPAFFALTGLQTRIGLLAGVQLWFWCLGVIVVASIGKIGGTFLGAHLAGLDRRDAWAMGALMNTRGLIELIVLNIGLEKGVLSPALFTMLVVMALVTTMMTAPLLQWLRR